MSYELVRCSRAQESFSPYRVVNQNSIRLCAHTMGGKIVNFSSDPDSPVCATRFGLSTETRPDNILAQITVECKNCPQRRRSLQKKMQFLRPLYISCVWALRSVQQAKITLWIIGNRARELCWIDDRSAREEENENFARWSKIYFIHRVKHCSNKNWDFRKIFCNFEQIISIFSPMCNW